MSERSDAFDLLRRLDPIAAEEFTAADEARLEDIIAGRIAADELAPRRRARQLVAAAVLVAAVAGTAAWAILRRESVTDPVAVACHRTAAVDGDVVLVERTGDPVTDCTALWRDGTFGDGEVPPLTACARPGGAAAVFPAGAEICEELGLATIGDPGPDSVAVGELQSRLRLAFGAVCVTQDEATAIVERTLDELGLVGWRIEYTAPFSAERPCAGVGIAPSDRMVALGGRLEQVPVPPASVTP